MKKSTIKIIDNLIERLPKLSINKIEIEESIKLLKEMYFLNKKLLICGNGGSAADSLHIVGELGKSFVLPRKLNDEFQAKIRKNYPEEANYFISNLQEGISAISIINETALITAYGNDNNPNLIFAQQVYVQGRKDDILFAISTSGNSKNVINAMKIAKIKGMKIISLTGKNGGEMKKISDININVNEKETYRIQEYHLPIYHSICLALENEIFGGEE